MLWRALVSSARIRARAPSGPTIRRGLMRCRGNTRSPAASSANSVDSDRTTLALVGREHEVPACA